MRKPAAAELLWPGADSVHAMDSLYKVCTALRHMRCLPLSVDRDTLWLDISRIDSDIARFDRLYRYRNVPECCTAAIDLYTAPFLINEYYEWSARAEAYYDMRYMQLLSLAEKASARSETRPPHAITGGCWRSFFKIPKTFRFYSGIRRPCYGILGMQVQERSELNQYFT